MTLPGMVSALFFFNFLTNIAFYIKQIGGNLMFSSAISTNLAIFWGKKSPTFYYITKIEKKTKKNPTCGG
jgi:hypothetical protein